MDLLQTGTHIIAENLEPFAKQIIKLNVNLYIFNIFSNDYNKFIFQSSLVYECMFAKIVHV